MIFVAFIKKRRTFAPLVLPDNEAVIVKIHGSTVEERYNTRIEFDNFVDRLQWVMGNIGEVSDVEAGIGEVTITMLGESAEEMYGKLRKVMRHTSLSKNASVILRFGPPGSRERRTHMAN